LIISFLIRKDNTIVNLILQLKNNNGNDNTFCGNYTSPCLTIQQTILNSNEGNIICVWAEINPYNCIEGGIIVNKNLIIQSYNGIAVIDCKNNLLIGFILYQFSIINGFLIKNAQPGILSFSGLQVNNCIFFNNTNGIYVTLNTTNNINITLSNNTFQSNNANRNINGGGGVDLEFYNSSINNSIQFFNNSFKSNHALIMEEE